MGRIGLGPPPGAYPLLHRDATVEFGLFVSRLLPKRAVLALSGDLGAGKTTFVQGLAKGLGIDGPIQSPTFILLNLYPGLAHFDLYRLKGENDFIGLGFEEYFSSDLICALEWPDRIATLLPKESIHIHFEYRNEGRIAHVK